MIFFSFFYCFFYIALHGLSSSTVAEALVGGLLACLDVLGQGDSSAGLGEDQLDVAGVGHVRVDATVGSVSPPPLLGGSIHLQVRDNQVVGIQALGLYTQINANSTIITTMHYKKCINVKLKLPQRWPQRFGEVSG